METDDKEIKKLMEKAVKENDTKAMVKLIEIIIEFDKQLMTMIKELRNLVTANQAKEGNEAEKAVYIS